MKLRIVAIALLLVVALVACGGNEPTPQPQATEAPALEPANTQPAATEQSPAVPAATALPDDYPVPTTPTLPAGYPIPATPTLPANYPAGVTGPLLWIIRPLGQQCSEASSYEFAVVDEAVAALTAAGVEVYNAEMISLAVCESCDCPTSEHFRVQIDPSDLATAVSLGWQAEP